MRPFLARLFAAQLAKEPQEGSAGDLHLVYATRQILTGHALSVNQTRRSFRGFVFQADIVQIRRNEFRGPLARTLA